MKMLVQQTSTGWRTVSIVEKVKFNRPCKQSPIEVHLTQRDKQQNPTVFSIDHAYFSEETWHDCGSLFTLTRFLPTMRPCGSTPFTEK